MKTTKADYLKSVDKPAPVDLSYLHGINELLRIAPQLESMTGSEEWDKFLSFLQGMLSKAESDKSSLQEQLNDGDLFEASQLMRVKAQVMCLGERIHVLREVMGLPGKILSETHKSKGFVQSLVERLKK